MLRFVLLATVRSVCVLFFLHFSRLHSIGASGDSERFAYTRDFSSRINLQGLNAAFSNVFAECKKNTT